MLQLYNIIPELQPYVKVICTMESNAADALPHPFRVLPDTCVEIFINYTDASFTHISGKADFSQHRSFVVSRMNHFMDVKQPGVTGCLAVCFYPGMAHHFFDWPMNEITNEVVSLADVWKQTGLELEDKIVLSKNNQHRVSILQQYLLQLLARNNKKDKAVEYCLWQMNLLKGQLTIGDLSDKTGISNRQLARRFNQQIGLAPKEFARIVKFISSLPLLKKYPSLSLTGIAYEAGYYDQAHFIRDYKEFSGHSPRRLVLTDNLLY